MTDSRLNQQDNQRPLIWITGASSGIGRSTTLEAGRRGYRLAITARRVALLEQLKEELASNGGRPEDVLVVPADVTQLSEVRNAYAAISSRFGSIDILLANAGTNLPSHSSTFQVLAYKELYEINFFGVLNCIEVALPDMRRRSAGQIAAVSSVAGYRALPTAAAYGSSKAALTYFLESLRFDVEKDGIAVTVISPGFVKTPLTDKNDFPMPFIISPEQAALRIMDGIEGRAFEIHFPKRFTLLLKLLGLLPKRVYHWIVSWSVPK